MERVLIRSFSERCWNLVRESAQDSALTAAGALAILGDCVPVIGWDDSGFGGELVFPMTDDGWKLATMLADQLETAIRAGAACPAETFPEPGAPDVDADGFAEPAGGEGARVAAEDAAHEAALKAAAAAPPAAEPADPDRAAYNGWRSGDRFMVLDRDDAARAAAASYLWPVWWGGASVGHVVSRCEIHLAGHHTVPGLLIDCEGLSRPTVIAAATLSACARKVTA